MKSTDKWTNEEIAAQLVFPRISADEYYRNENYRDEIQELAKSGVGGFCIFKGGVNPTKTMINELQGMAEVPLMFCADFEWGLLMRLNDGAPFPHAMALGNIEGGGMTEEVASAIAQETKYAGVHWNLAPVCDINSNPDNPVINVRSFGEEKETVAKHSNDYIIGLQKEKVIACAKHFPGHGDTSVDSHIELPVLEKTIDEIEVHELFPFREAIKTGVKSIMLGHLSVPALDPSGLPASISPVIVQYLRNKLGFRGIIVTDGLDMGALKKYAEPDETALKSLMAGSDVALIPEKPAESIKNIIAEIDSNNSFREHALESVNRIIKEKRWCGLTTQVQTIDTDRVVNFAKNEKTALKAAFEALKMTGNESLIPIPEDKIFAGFAFMQDSNIDVGTKFFQYTAQALENDCDFGFLSENISDDEINELKERLTDTELFIFAFFYRGKGYIGNAGFRKDVNKIIQKIAGEKPKIGIIFGNPYLKRDIECDLFIDNFSDSLSSVAASVMLLSDRKPVMYD